MNDVPSTAYFIDGGTLRANTPSYVERPADNELFEALLNREYCYILTPRQMGKSSLMIRTSQRLKDQNIQTAVVDIQGIGTNQVREWYASLLSRIRRGLKLSVDIDEWMTKKSNIGFGQLFSDFIQDVVLTEIAEPVVIFLDEVDWMIKIDFRDDFFASIRSMYNARAQYPEFNRISFVLLGVASPADLISEPTRTPFNIGHSIPLEELSLEEAVPLEDGLEKVCPSEGKRILDRIFYWTNGHPYLTQKICKSIAETIKPNWSNENVDELVQKVFLSEESRKEANLKFIQDRILGNEQRVDLLKFYRRVLKTRVRDDSQSVLQKHLILSGLVIIENGLLVVRNRIYETIFDQKWIYENLPRDWQRLALVATSSLVVLLFAVIGYNYTVSLRLKTYQTDYIRGDPAQKITALANIYGLRYWFSSNTDIDAIAAQAFYEFTPDSETQLSLFPPYGENDRVKQQDMVTVIGKLYVTLANVDEETDNTSLLQAMDNALQHSVLNSRSAKDLQQELSNWISGRTGYKNKDYVAALTGYSDAISINSGNQATLYERAKVYVELGQYENALKDLNAAIGAAQESAPDVPTSTPTNSPFPLSETPAPRVTETLLPNKTLTITVTPTFGATSTSIPLTPSPEVTPSIQPVPVIPDKFESNFTTLNHVIVAVKALIDETLELQQALQPPATAYSNLNSVGLVKVYPKPTADQNVLYRDDFTNPASGWPEEQFDNFFIGYHEPEYYHVEIDSPNYKTTVFEPEKKNFSDVTIEVKVLTDSNKTDPKGDFRYGVVFRRSGDQYYAFTISPRTKKWFVVKNSSNTLVILAEGTDSSIHDQDADDTLRLDAQGSTFYFSINDELVGQLTDPDYASGEVGFYVETFDSPAVHIHFNSITVRNVQAIPLLAGTVTQSTNFTLGSTIPHQVVEGDWLVQIARCYGADLNAVQNANPQINDANASLLPGTIVTVPNIGSNGTIYGPPCVIYYTVQSGDTWNSIAAKFNVDVLILQATNQGVALSNGVSLRIPATGQSISTLTPTLVPSATFEIRALELEQIFFDPATTHLGDEVLPLPIWERLFGACYEKNFETRLPLNSLILGMEVYDTDADNSITINDKPASLIPNQDIKSDGVWDRFGIPIPINSIQQGINSLKICSALVSSPDFLGDLDDFQIRNIDLTVER